MMHSRNSLLEWAMPCGTWFGHRVRMSALFVFVPVILGLQLWEFRLALLVGIFLAVAVLIHEIALVGALRLAGGEVRELFLWPLGGIPRLASSSIGPAPVASVIAALVSAAVCVMSLAVLLQSNMDWSILNPLTLPVTEIAGDTQYDLLALFCFANWIVLLANLLPAQPMDGGRVMDSIVTSRVGSTVGHQVVIRAGMAVGLAMIVSALLLESVWLCAIGAALAGYNLRESLRAQTSENFDESFMGYDFSQGYTSLERSTTDEPHEHAPGPVQRWLARRRSRRAKRLREKAEQTEREMDALLQKVHTYGIESLTDAERRTLRRLSAKYRGRANG